MAKIKVDIDALTGNSSVLNSRIAELQSLNSRLEDLINRIDASWEGQASVTYINTMRTHAAKAKKMVAVLSEYKKYVDSAISKFSNVDKNAASKIRNSF